MCPPHAHVNPTIRALFLITSQPAARLDEPTRWSDELNSFVEATLQKEPTPRPSAQQLLGHPLVERGVALGSTPVHGMLRRATESRRESCGEVSSSSQPIDPAATIDMMAAPPDTPNHRLLPAARRTLIPSHPARHPTTRPARHPTTHPTTDPTTHAHRLHHHARDGGKRAS